MRRSHNLNKKPLAVEIVWSQLLLCGGEWKTRKQIYEELLEEGFERRYVDWYMFCLPNHQPGGNMSEEAQAQGPFSQFRLVRKTDVTGISGTGIIALGIQWPDQSCHLFWPKHGTHGWYPSIGVLRAVHCYDVYGQPNAIVEWLNQGGSSENS